MISVLNKNIKIIRFTGEFSRVTNYLKFSMNISEDISVLKSAHKLDDEPAELFKYETERGIYNNYMRGRVFAIHVTPYDETDYQCSSLQYAVFFIHSVKNLSKSMQEKSGIEVISPSRITKKYLTQPIDIDVLRDYIPYDDCTPLTGMISRCHERNRNIHKLCTANALQLVFHIPIVDYGLTKELEEHTSHTYVYNIYAVHYLNTVRATGDVEYLSSKPFKEYHKKQMGERAVVNDTLINHWDLLRAEERANLFYVVKGDRKIGYWRLSKLFSVMFYSLDLQLLSDQLKLSRLLETLSEGDILFSPFDERIRSKYALKCRPSVLFNKIFKPEFCNVHIQNHAIEEFYHAYYKSCDGEFEIVEGDKIREYYHKENYYETENGSPLSESCMRHDSCGEFFDIYTRNPKVCKMLIYKHTKTELIMGRAILWKVYDSELDREIDVMDRIYHCYENVRSAFLAWAVDNKYATKGRQSYDDYYFHAKFEGSKDIFGDRLVDDVISKTDRWYIKLQETGFSYYPYMDTFYLLYDNTLYIGESTIVDSYDCMQLRCTSGGWEDDENSVYLEYLGERHHTDDCCWSEYHDCYIHTDDACYSDYHDTYYFSEECVYCEDIDSDVHEEEATWSDADNCYYMDTVYSRHMESYISKKDSVEVICAEDYMESDYVYSNMTEVYMGETYIEDSDSLQERKQEHEDIFKHYSTSYEKIEKLVNDTMKKLAKKYY